MRCLSSDAQKHVDKQRIQQRIVWAGMTGALFALAVVAHVAPTPNASQAMDLQAVENMHRVLSMVAVMLIAVSIALSQWGKSERRISASGNRSVASGSAFALMCGRFSEGDRPAILAVTSSMIPLIISLALSEAATIIGFVVAQQSSSPQEIYPFLAGSLLANFLSFPDAKIVAEKAMSSRNF